MDGHPASKVLAQRPVGGIEAAVHTGKRAHELGVPMMPADSVAQDQRPREPVAVPVVAKLSKAS